MIPFQRPCLIINVLFYRDPEEQENQEAADAAIIVSKIIKAYY